MEELDPEATRVLTQEFEADFFAPSRSPHDSWP
jgi:hypothetical protein